MHSPLKQKFFYWGDYDSTEFILQKLNSAPVLIEHIILIQIKSAHKNVTDKSFYNEDKL